MRTMQQKSGRGVGNGIAGTLPRSAAQDLCSLFLVQQPMAPSTTRNGLHAHAAGSQGTSKELSTFNARARLAKSALTDGGPVQLEVGKQSFHVFVHLV